MKRETCLSNNLLRRFKTSTGGAFAIWAATATPVLVGGAALSVDASRLYNMDQELQSASDALARAGAAELDQRPDSLFRAARAVQNLVRNDQKFAEIRPKPAIYKLILFPKTFQHYFLQVL